MKLLWNLKKLKICDTQLWEKDRLETSRWTDNHCKKRKPCVSASQHQKNTGGRKGEEQQNSQIWKRHAKGSLEHAVKAGC